MLRPSSATSDPTITSFALNSLKCCCPTISQEASLILESNKLFIINTCNPINPKKGLNLFRMNTYDKPPGEGCPPESSHPCPSRLVDSVKQKLAPRGELPSAHNRPPCASTIDRLIESPMPVP